MRGFPSLSYTNIVKMPAKSRRIYIYNNNVSASRSNPLPEAKNWKSQTLILTQSEPF